MSKVIDMWEWKRARLGRGGLPLQLPRPPRRRREGANGGFVRIGVVSDALLRRLTE